MKKINKIAKNYFKKMSKATLFVLLLIFILILFFILVSNKSKKLKEASLKDVKKEIPINIIVLPVKTSTIYDRINLAAETKAWENLKLQTQVAGEIVKKKVKEGDFVNKGDIVVLINSQKYKNAFNSSNAIYEATLSKFNRTKNLYEKKISKKADFDDVKALMKQSKAAMEVAKIDLDNCEIKAPISGFINNIFVEKGEIVTIGSPIVQILNTKKIKVRVGIPESDITKIKNINNFIVEIEALNKKKFHAKKYFLSRGTSDAIRLYALDIEIDNSNGEILADMFARVDIIKKKVENCIAIPINAIINKDKKKIVYIEKDGKAYEKEVTLGIQEGFMFEITKGLDVGDNLIIMGQNNLSDKQLVKVIKENKD